MKFTLSWLKQHLKTTATPQEIAEKLVSIGHEVETVEDTSAVLGAFIVAHVIKVRPHPDADKLQICTVEIGEVQPVELVCGDPKVRAGVCGVYACEGATIPATGQKLKKATIRGVESRGMLCSKQDLAIEEKSNGIIELQDECVTKVGKDIVSALDFGDVFFDVALTPNRGDCFGVYGLARDLAAAGLGELLPLKNIEVAGTFKSPITVKQEGEALTLCPHFTGRYIKGVKNGPSPLWLQEKLKSVGLKSISALVDVTNYFCHDRCRPLHVFDADKLKGNLRLHMAKEGDKFLALDEKTYVLDSSMVVISDDETIVSLGGIMGGLDSGCTDETTNVFLEAAYFDAAAIAKAGQKTGIISDARMRFERGMDPLCTLPGIEAATRMILDLCGGEVSDVVQAGETPYKPCSITFHPFDVKKLSGLAVDAEECCQLLKGLGCHAVSLEDGFFDVSVPSWRHDLRLKQDLVEEILRLKGYDSVPLQPMELLADCIKVLTPKDSVLERTKRRLASFGLLETITYTFISDKMVSLFGSSRLSVVNPISEDMRHMRSSLLPQLVAGVERNIARGNNNLALFEFGARFDRDVPHHQEMTLGAVYSGQSARQHWSGLNQYFSLTHVKAHLEGVLKDYGLTSGNYQWVQDKEKIPAYMHPGKCAVLCQGPKRILGYIGAVHPGVLKKLDVKQDVLAFELYLDRLAAPKPRRYDGVDLSSYQPVERDFAVVVDVSVPAATLQSLVAKVDSSLVQWVDVFDVYQGKGVEPGKKSVALRVRLQSMKATLTEDDISAFSDKVIKLLQDKAGATLR